MMKNFLYISLFLNVLLLSEKLSAQTNFELVGNKTGFSNLSLKETRQIFKAKYSVWASGQSVIIVLPSPKNLNADQVCKLIYENSISGVQKFWLSLVFQGRANPPVFLDSDEEILSYVSKNPGAIGLVSKEALKVESNMHINLNY
jgi:ABC-type phosphate transport system substrate-binding protein